MAKRVFTDKELQEMGTPAIDLLKQAVDAGDKERAKDMADRMANDYSILHDLYMDWIGALMSCVYTNQGEEALYEVMRGVFGADGPPDPREGNFREKVQMVAAALRGHMVPIKIVEDDEKVSLTMEPCGSGEKLLKTGRYEPQYNFTRIQKPHPMTWGMTDFPIYCTHAPVLEILSIERYGYPMSPCAPAEKVAQSSCRHCVYKNLDDIPEEVYSRVGKKKPKS